MGYFHTPQGQAGMKTYDDFYHNAEHGTLPSFSWILPRQGQNTTTKEGPNDDHPCHDIALGERLLKDTYEALRASPKWNNTLLLVLYDDPGGWYDHASVPVGVPAPDNISSFGPDKNVSFTWLGARGKC
jgi:phospholipase C